MKTYEEMVESVFRRGDLIKSKKHVKDTHQENASAKESAYIEKSTVSNNTQIITNKVVQKAD